MDAADLDYRARTLSGCIPPSLVTRLLELGHEREAEFQAGRGEWFCALQWARLLARHGRAAEALAPLRPGIEDWFIAQALVDVAEAAGQDKKVAALLTARIEAAVPACDDPDCDRLRMEPSNAVDLLAAVRERQGRVDEAIALLRRREVTSVNGRDTLADLLARHGRLEELRAYTDFEYQGHAARSLAEVLEERGDEEGAIAVYRTFAEKPHGMWRVAHPLSQLLVRHGRVDEAIAAMRALADSPGGADDCVVDTLCTLYAEHGRAQEALAYLDALKERRDGEEEWEIFRMRLPLMADCGLRDEAIEQARAHPEGGTWYAAWSPWSGATQAPNHVLEAKSGGPTSGEEARQ